MLPFMETTTSLAQLLEEVAAVAPDDARGLAVVELRVAPGDITPIHAHDHDEAFHVLDGEIVLHFASESVRLRAGDGYTAPSGQPHAVSAGDGGARYLTTTFTRSVSRYADFQQAVAQPAGSDGAVRGRRASCGRSARAAGIAVLGFARVAPSDQPDSLRSDRDHGVDVRQLAAEHPRRDARSRRPDEERRACGDVGHSERLERDAERARRLAVPVGEERDVDAERLRPRSVRPG